MWASDEDIQIRDQEKENTDTAKDEFFGDGQGSVKPSDITEAAGLTSGVKGSFSGAGSPSDVFYTINSSDSYSFFSQEVSDSLDTVGFVSVASAEQEDDSWMDVFSSDEDGYYSLVDTSAFDVLSFLAGDNS